MNTLDQGRVEEIYTHDRKNRSEEEEVVSKDWCKVEAFTSTGRHGWRGRTKGLVTRTNTSWQGEVTQLPVGTLP